MSVILGSEAFQYNGVAGISLVRKRRTRSAVYGLGWMLEFQGTPAAVNAALLTLPDWCEGETDESGPTHTLIVRYSDDPSESSATNTVRNSYELLGNSLQKDIREHPRVLALGLTTINAINTALNAPTPTAAQLSAIGAADSFARTVYESMRKRNGQMAYSVAQYVFRATTYASRRAQIDVALDNVDEIYSAAEVISESGATSGMAASVLSVSAGTTVAPGHVWGWLKQTPTITNAPGNRVAIQREWWLEQWEEWVYTPA